MGGVLHEISPSALKQMIDQNEVILIDVREHFEYDEEHIPGAKLYPTSIFNPNLVPQANGKKLVFYCAAGRRSANAAIKWRENGGFTEAYSLKGGISAWKKAGLQVVVDPKEISNLFSKTLLVIGALFILLSLFSFMTDAFLWVNLLLGLAIILAGTTDQGKSLLARILSKIFPNP